MKRATADEVIRSVSASTGIPVDLIVGPSKARHIHVARKAVMARLAGMGWSCSQIGRRLNRHHTTIMYGIGQVRKVAP